VTVAKYAPRVQAHPDRYGGPKGAPSLFAVLHTSEGSEGEASAEALTTFMRMPGDRPTGEGRYGSSYHVVFDTDDVIPVVPYEVVAFAASGANTTGIHGCFPGKARQSRAEWLDPISRAYIRQCAAWLLDLEVQRAIPVTRITSAQMKAGVRGLADHWVVTQAFRKSTHTDVGAEFPWDVLLSDVAALRPKPPVPTLPTPKPPTVKETLMVTVFLPTDCLAEFIALTDANGNGLDIEWISTPEDQRRRDAHIAAGAKVVRGPHRNGRFKNLTLNGPLPTGDSYFWTEDDFHKVRA
jgi:hypothetical protein